MTTLRVRLDAPTRPDRADPWATFDTAGDCVRTGVDRPAAWPAADRLEVVLAASQLRIASVKLPPLPASRVAGAVAFALEDQLAAPIAALRLATSAQASDGHVRVIVVANSLLADIANARSDIARIIAEPELAPLTAGWRWCAGDDGSGFVRRRDGSAFPVQGPAQDGALPAELAIALAQARRDDAVPAQIRVEAPCDDAAPERWQRESGVPFVRGTPWKWHAASPVVYASATDLRPPASTVTTAGATRRGIGRVFAPALVLVAVALAIHVVASVGEWASLRYDAWRDGREWTALAAAAGVPGDAASTPQAARAALARRYSELRHGAGLPAPDDALPLLARAAPALTALPPGSVKSATYADGYWTLDIARADPAAIRDLDARMRAVRLPSLMAASATGTRVRFGGP